MTTALLLVTTIVSMLLHEAAHGLVATACGDPIPGRWKRDTLNLFAHVDPIATIVFPLVTGLVTHGRILIGAARPMPIGWNHLSRRDQLAVIFAGPAVNMLCAGGAAADYAAHGNAIALTFARGQLLLVALNLLPIPPLDGWRLVQWTRRSL
jgi:Zn-dependent protease